MAEFAFVKISGNPKNFGQSLSLTNTVYAYDMSGFDSTGGTRVYWTSIGFEDTAPIVTSPALVGSLVYPHTVNVRLT